MRKYTYGFSKAAVELYEITKGNSKCQRKVGRTLSEFQILLNNISDIKDKKIRNSLLNITYKYFKDKIGLGLIRFDDDEVIRFLLNVLDARFRTALKLNEL